MKRIAIIEGAQLSSVEFVRDYFQLRFDGPTLTVNAPVTMSLREKSVSSNDRGFRDLLCERIGCQVIGAMVLPGQELRIDFEDGSRLGISLKDEDQVSPEAVVLSDGNRTLDIW